MNKNQCIDQLVAQGHTLQVVYLNKLSINLIVGLKVSPHIRSTVLREQSGFIFLGGKRIPLRDRFHVKQCYHCQKLGHISIDCPEKANNPTCLYCMGKHRSGNCYLKQITNKHCCAKCHTSKYPDDVANYDQHNSASLDCPVLIRECMRLASITDFSNNKKIM